MPMSNAFQEFGPITQDPNTGGNLPTIFDKGESENSNPETNQYADSVLSHKNFAGIQSFPLTNQVDQILDSNSMAASDFNQ